MFPHLTRPLLALTALALPAIAHAQGGSLIIWPLNPTIKAQEKAAALWLENPGENPITFQVQSYAWAQQNGEDVYAPQTEVMATPPIVTLAPKSKQLIRLTRLGPPPAQAERAYRLIVDEIPIERGASATTSVSTGVQFRMRYSLPLFTYGVNMLPASEATTGPAKKGEYPTPDLIWHFAKNGKQRVIDIENRGNGHARLTQAKLTTPNGEVDVASGLMGYVLPGSRLRYVLPETAASFAGEPTFIASVNSAAPALLAPQRAAPTALASAATTKP